MPDPTLQNGGDQSTSGVVLPPSATNPPASETDSEGNMPTQSSPVSGQLQPPPAHPEPSTPPITAISPNVRTHNFIARAASGLLDAIVGKQGPSYSYDSNGKLITTAAPPMTVGQKLRKLSDQALSGLAAGAQVGPQKSAAASIAAGLGAGAQAIKQGEKEQDLLKRKQASDSYEKEQQAMLQHHEIGRLNALTTSTYFQNKKMANEMTPEFAQNESLINAAKTSPELGAHVTEMSDTQLAAEEAKDHMFTQTHIIKPLGWAPEMDKDGNPVMSIDADGNSVPKMFMRIGVVDATKTGKIALTPELADDFQKYGGMARIPNAATLKAGDEYELSSLVPALARVEEQKKQVLAGWQNSETGWRNDKDGNPTIPVETNKVIPLGDPSRTRDLQALPASLKEGEAKSDQEAAQAEKARADAQKALSEAALNASMTISPTGDLDKNSIPAYVAALQNLSQPAQTVLRNVPPIWQVAVLQAANGDLDINEATKNPRKGVPVVTPLQLAAYAKLINPDWTQQMFKNKQEAVASFNAKNGDAIKSLNQFFVHADDLRQDSDKLKRTNSPWLNQPLNKIRTAGMGQPGVPALMTDIQTTRSEWQNFIKNGHAADLADTEEGRAIMNDASTPRQIMDAAQAMGRQVIGRADQLDAAWRRTWGGHFPGLISNSGRTAAENLGFAEALKDYPKERGMFGVKPSEDVMNPGSYGNNPQQIQSPDNPAQRPPGATGIAPGSDGRMYYHDIKGNVLGLAPQSVQEKP